MFENGIEEQLVKEKTGHKSDAVHTYKHTSDQLMEQAEKAIICPGQSDEIETIVPWKAREFDIDDDISSFELFCTKKTPKSLFHKGQKCCSNGLCALFGEGGLSTKKVKKIHVSIEYRK